MERMPDHKKMFGNEANFFACGLSLVLHQKPYGAYGS
jgi:coproporphyrinogen III oxidase